MKVLKMLTFLIIIVTTLVGCSLNSSPPRNYPEVVTSSSGTSQNRFSSYAFTRVKFERGYTEFYILSDKDGSDYMVFTSSTGRKSVSLATVKVVDKDGNAYVSEQKDNPERFSVKDVGEHATRTNGDTNYKQYVLVDKETQVEYLVITSSFENSQAGVTVTPIL